jgi:hypothetical protein
MLSMFTLLSRFYPKSRWAIVRKDIPTIKRNIYPSWEKIKPTSFILQDANDSNQQTVTFKNGSKIIFFAENYDTDKELNRWRGLEVNGIGFEEINECQYASLLKAFERAGSYVIPNAIEQPKPIVCATANPSFGWVKEMIYNPYRDGTLRPNWPYIQSRIYDNIPLLTEQPNYLPSLKKNLNRFEYEVFVEGNWDIQLKTGGEIYKCFEMDKHIKDVFYNPEMPLHISFDENVTPYLSVVISQINGNEVYIINEISGVDPNNTVKAVCEEFKRIFPNHQSGLFIYGDATSRKEDTKLEKGFNFFRLITDHLKDYRPTLRVPAANPSVKMRLSWINTIFEKKTIKIMISPTCKKLINDFVTVKEAPDGTKNKETATDPNTKKSYQINAHHSDCFDYFMCAAFSKEYELYRNPNKPTTFTPPQNILHKDFKFTL